LHPDAEVIIIWGDGSSGYGLMEFDTFVRHKLNIKAIIGTNKFFFNELIYNCY